MKYFFDTEFIEWAGGIQLVSIGIVREDGATFYAESSTFDERLADDWVRINVIAKLRFKGSASRIFTNGENWEMYGSEQFIASTLLMWIGNDRNPEFYAYFASYDWVVFARMFGRLIDKPKHFPMWVIDLKQMMWERGLTKEWKRENHPDPDGEHNALVDAIWNKRLHDKILQHPLINVSTN